MSRLLRLKEVMELTSMPRSTIYAYMKKGLFPQNKKLTQKSVVWREDEIKKWIDSRVEASWLWKYLKKHHLKKHHL